MAAGRQRDDDDGLHIGGQIKSRRMKRMKRRGGEKRKREEKEKERLREKEVEQEPVCN